MKVKKRFLLPLMLLFTLVMTCSAIAKPRLESKTITFTMQGGTNESFASKEYDLVMFFLPKCNLYYNVDDIYLIGVSKNAYVPTQKVTTENGTLVFESPSEFDYRTGKRVYKKPENGLLRVDVYVEGAFNIYRGMAGADGGTVVEREFTRNKTYKVKLNVVNNNKRISVGPVKIRFRNNLAKTISYLKIGNKKFTTPFRSSNSNKIIDLKGVPTGKPVKITFKTSGQLKNAKYFCILRTRKAYKNGSKVVLKKGDVLMIVDKYEFGNYIGSVPIFINVNHAKYKTIENE